MASISVFGQVCSQVWCSLSLVGNLGFFELQKFPWLPRYTQRRLQLQGPLHHTWSSSLKPTTSILSTFSVIEVNDIENVHYRYYLYKTIKLKKPKCTRNRAKGKLNKIKLKPTIPYNKWCPLDLVYIHLIIIIIIHSQYFPDSDWLKAHA